MQTTSTTMTKRDLLQIIGQHARDILPNLESHEFAGSDRLIDLGANSVDRAEIAMRVQETLNISVPLVELFGSRNIGELAELFLKKLDAC